MSDTLDGMTVAQLDELIARAQATKEKVEEKDWVLLPPQMTSPDQLRLNCATQVIESLQYGGWERLPIHTEAFQFVTDNLGSKNDRTNIARALLALNDHTK